MYLYKIGKETLSFISNTEFGTATLATCLSGIN